MNIIHKISSRLAFANIMTKLIASQDKKSDAVHVPNVMCKYILLQMCKRMIRDKLH